MQVIKLTDGKHETKHTKWKAGREQKIDPNYDWCDELCSPGWFHSFPNIETAILFRPHYCTHYWTAWEATTGGKVKQEQGCRKLGSKRLTLTKILNRRIPRHLPEGLILGAIYVIALDNARSPIIQHGLKCWKIGLTESTREFFTLCGFRCLHNSGLFNDNDQMIARFLFRAARADDIQETLLGLANRNHLKVDFRSVWRRARCYSLANPKLL